MRFDYELLISVIVGATNIIPFFGPFFGAIPSALLLLLSSPHQVLPFILLIVVIQQLDGNVIGPKILGNSTGLSAFWEMFAIIVGGGFFGFPGMVIGVPVFAVVYSIMDEFVCYTLRRKGLSDLTSDYAPIPAIHDEKKSTDLTPKKSFRLWRPNKNTHDDKNETTGNDDENDAGVE
jgi:predicted PurR-regulated permease PerM